MQLERSGTIINIIVMGGRSLRPNYICGVGENAALIGLTNVLGFETPDYNVRVFGINPSPTLTDRMIELDKVRTDLQLGDANRWKDF